MTDTVEINRHGQRVIINKAKYDPSIHTLWGEEVAETPKIQHRTRRKVKRNDD